MQPVILACDQGAGVGLGHRRRCEAIAAELNRRGVKTAIVHAGRGVLAAPIIVVDSYRFRADDRHAFVPDHVIAIDDLSRNLAVDIAVIPAPGADASNYRNASVVLAGAKYAIIDPAISNRAGEFPCEFPREFPGEFPGRSADQSANGLRGVTKRIVVTMGASDSTGIGQRIAGDCRTLDPDAEVRLVVGPWGDDAVPPGVVAVYTSRGLIDEFLAADVVITAAGVSLLEAMALGAAVVAVETAANQYGNIEAIQHADAACVASAATAAHDAVTLLNDPVRSSLLSANAWRLIDGRGAARVVDALFEVLASHAVVAA